MFIIGHGNKFCEKGKKKSKRTKGKDKKETVED